MNMFCYQCEQAKDGKGCDQIGVCGKDAQTAALQDLLVYAVKDIARFAHRARQLGEKDRAIDRFVIRALFSTVTNVNFDAGRLKTLLTQAGEARRQAAELYGSAARKAGKSPDPLDDGVKWHAGMDRSEAAAAVGLARRRKEIGEDITGLQELVTYGLKGMAAYADHAAILGLEDDDVYGFFHEALDYLTRRPVSAEALLGMALRVGEVNLKVMGMLDAANTGAYGQPAPTRVRVTPVKGKCIVVSGHDLKDLATLLEQTQGKGINVYTHGEMLPCLAYPGLKKYAHLVGNYGGAWQNQAAEFDRFPGAILMTTNCIQRPGESYKGRLFTSGLVAWPGAGHISNGDFAPVIKAALAAPGFEADEPGKTITVGFGHDAVMNVAGAVIDAVKAGKIRRFFLIGGCDGAKPGRNYYTELARQVPSDCVILTLACGKYRFNKLDFGDIGGIPRLLDVGQCNDSYSAVQIALALAKAFNCGVNDLPLSLVLSWYEQKAVCILLTLLHLGVKNIRVGPSLPAFVPPAALDVLVKKFNLMPITTPQQDLKAMLA
jgi:hydroxylamine reductase